MNMSYLFGILGTIMAIFAGIHWHQKNWFMLVIDLLTMTWNAYLFIIL